MTDGDLELRVAWEQHVSRSPAANEHFASVVNRYREAHRSYHDVRHVRWVVRHVGEFAETQRVVDLGTVVVAAFYHDAIYNPVASGNEDASATLAAEALAELDWQRERIDAVTSMIAGTIDHQWNESTPVDTAVLYAADLGILAADPAGYSAYVRNVRKEYAHVDQSDWVSGRSAVLRSFLDRSAIFAPQLGLTEWEMRARGNLTAELDQLESAPS